MPSISVIVFLIVFAIGMFLTFRHPFYGVALYVFEWHNHPPYMPWGDVLPDPGWSLVISLTTLASFLLNKRKLTPLYFPNYQSFFWLALLVFNVYLVTHFFAILPGESAEKALEVLKLAVLFVIMAQSVRTYKNYQILVWVIILCVCNFGKMAFELGGERDLGFWAPNATEENGIAIYVITVLPFFGIYFVLFKKWWQRGILLAGIVLAFNLLVHANSRGAIVGLGAIAIFALLWIGGKTRVTVIAGLIAGALIFFNVSNDSFKDRVSTIFVSETEERDGSAKSREYIWAGAWEMFLDHPAGVGGGGFIELSTQYVEEIEDPKSQHNTFIAILTDWGFLGLILYLAFLAHTMIILRSIKRRTRHVKKMHHFYLEASALQLAIIGVSFGGITHSRQYAEIVYWVGAMALVLQNLVRTAFFEVYFRQAITEQEKPESDEFASESAVKELS